MTKRGIVRLGIYVKGYRVPGIGYRVTTDDDE